MEKEVQPWPENIKQAIDEIESYLPENRDFLEFTIPITTHSY